MVLKLLVGVVEIQTAKVLNDEPALPLTFVGTIFDLSKSQSAQQSVSGGQAPYSNNTTTASYSTSRIQETSQTTKSSNQMNETLPPYQAAAAGMPRSNVEKKMNDEIQVVVQMPPPTSNVDDL